MTLNELIEAIKEEEDESLFDTELFWYEEYEDETCYITKINACGLLKDKILLSKKCPLCDE